MTPLTFQLFVEAENGNRQQVYQADTIAVHEAGVLRTDASQ